MRNIIIITKKYKNWEPSNYQRDRIIYLAHKLIKEKLDLLQKELCCPNEFIYNFILDLARDWDPNNPKNKS